MYWRALIREGDSLVPEGGKVQPKPQKYPSTYGGKLACYEGDPVFCNACNSWGVTKCVLPYRPNTDPMGRQANLDGDLCICKCLKPPRLKALFDNARVIFGGTEIAGMLDAEGWLHHAGFLEETDIHDEQFIFKDVNGNPMAHMQYTVKLKSTGATMQGTTDKYGMTQRLRTASGGGADVEIMWGNGA